MDTVEVDGGSFVLRLTQDEVIVLYAALGHAEWSDDLREIQLDPGAERLVATDLMLALSSAVPHLGTDGYGPSVSGARARIAKRAWLREGIVFPAPDPGRARAWTSVVHQAARSCGGRVVGPMEGPAVGRSYYSIPLRIDGEVVTVLMNPAVSLVACVRGERPFPADAVFVKVPHVETFDLSGWTVADPSELELPLTEDDLVSLAADEAQQVRRHWPRRVGDLPFNWFD